VRLVVCVGWEDRIRDSSVCRLSSGQKQQVVEKLDAGRWRRSRASAPATSDRRAGAFSGAKVNCAVGK
jgi:hypothetical protein